MIRVAMITGLSGSGKTLALRCLEDLGYFAVDNLPVPLIAPFIDLLDRGEDQEPRGAFVVDVREREQLATVPAILKELRSRSDVRISVLFLEAEDETLIRRYSESRRPHPLASSLGLGVAEAIREERSLLHALRRGADRILETDALSPHDLRRVIRETLSEEQRGQEIHVQVVSFGFKYGTPKDIDLMLDVRFVENPYFEPTLRQLSGKDQPILDFLEEREEYREFREKLKDLLAFMMPRFIHEGKSYLTIAIGCTGGRHRSVALSEQLGHYLSQAGYPATVVHRDLERKAKQERQ